MHFQDDRQISNFDFKFSNFSESKTSVNGIIFGAETIAIEAHPPYLNMFFNNAGAIWFFCQYYPNLKKQLMNITAKLIRVWNKRDNEKYHLIGVKG